MTKELDDFCKHVLDEMTHLNTLKKQKKIRSITKKHKTLFDGEMVETLSLSDEAQAEMNRRGSIKKGRYLLSKL